MSKRLQYCPSCGATLVQGTKYCEKCGYLIEPGKTPTQTTPTAPVATSTSTSSVGGTEKKQFKFPKIEKKEKGPKEPRKAKSKEEIWPGMEKWLSRLAFFIWLLPIIGLVIAIVWNVIDYIGSIVLWALLGWSGLLSGIVGFIIDLLAITVQIIVSIVLILKWVKPQFADKCRKKDWQFLVADIVPIGKYSIPKMFLISILLMFFLPDWTFTIGFVMIIYGILIIRYAPVQFTWALDDQDIKNWSQQREAFWAKAERQLSSKAFLVWLIPLICLILAILADISIYMDNLTILWISPNGWDILDGILAIFRFLILVVLQIGISLYIIFGFVKPRLATRIKTKDWQGVVSDSLAIGKFNIPKILLYALLLAFFIPRPPLPLFAAGVILIFGGIIALYGPVKFEWILTDTQRTAMKKEVTSSWGKMESAISRYAILAWILPLIALVYSILYVLVGGSTSILQTAVSNFSSGNAMIILYGVFRLLRAFVILVVLSFLVVIAIFKWIKPDFTNKIRAKQWQPLVDDSVGMGKLLFPKFILMAVFLFLIIPQGRSLAVVFLVITGVLLFAYSPVTYDIVMNDAMKQNWLKQKQIAWPKTENTVIITGKFAWIVPLIYGNLKMFEGVFWIMAYPVWPLLVRSIWCTIVGVVLILVAFLYIKPRFSNQCAAKEWEFIVNDIVALKVLRIPKWLIFGLIIIILPFDAIPGILMLYAVLMIYIYRPGVYQWTLDGKPLTFSPGKGQAVTVVATPPPTPKPTPKPTTTPVTTQPSKPTAPSPTPSVKPATTPTSQPVKKDSVKPTDQAKTITQPTSETESKKKTETETVTTTPKKAEEPKKPAATEVKPQPETTTSTKTTTTTKKTSTKKSTKKSTGT